MRCPAFLAIVLFLFARVPARAARIEAPFPLAKFDASAGLIVKATAISTERAKPVRLFMDKFSAPVDAVTSFRIVSVLKGDLAPGSEFDFHHHSSAQGYGLIVGGGGAIYDFEIGRSYLLWAVRDGENWKAQQIYNFFFQTQGALLAPDTAPVAGATRDVVWAQANALLQSKNPRDVRAAIAYLASMSQRQGAADIGHSGDFTREAVVDAIAPLIDAPDSSVDVAAVSAMNLLPTRVMPRLLGLAGATQDARRPYALAALAEVDTPEVAQRMQSALADENPEIRTLAVSLLRHRAGETTQKALRNAALDSDARVRKAVIETIVQLGDTTLLTIVDSLSRDPNEKVAKSAENILSFVAAGGKLSQAF